MRIAFKRYFIEFDADEWGKRPSFCTCNSTKGILKLPPTPKMVAAGIKAYKSPNLAEAYKHFTGEELVGAHRALADAEACARVYFAMQPKKEAA